MKTTALLLALITAISSLRAQSDDPATFLQHKLPSGPLIKPIPDNYQWTVIVHQKGKAPGTSTTIIGQKKNSIYHIVSTTGHNSRWETWSNGKAQVISHSNWKTPLVSSGAPEEFPRPNWISPSNFLGMRKVNGTQYLVFRTKSCLLSEESIKMGLAQNPALWVDAIATIEESSRLPVAIQFGDEVTSYKFEALPPDATLTLPDEVKKQLAAYYHPPKQPATP